MKNKLYTIIMTALTTSVLTLCVVYVVMGNNVLVSKQEYENMSNAMVLAEIMGDVQTYFYGDVPKSEDMVNEAARSMVATLNDPYAAYFTADEYAEFYKSYSGEYKGYGLSIAKPDANGAKISEVYEDSPADKAGMRADDVIISVNGTAVAGLELDDITGLLATETKEATKIVVLRGGKELTFDIVPGEVTIKHVHGRLIDDETGYIYISMFSGNCAEEFESTYYELQEKGISSLVIDLRDNPGGNLDIVVGVCDVLIDNGNIVTVGKNAKDGQKFEATKGGTELNVVVLVNENSASASEIMAGALKDYSIAKIVGKTTYGKGIVQTTMHLSSNGGKLKFTTDAYFTPNGTNIHGKGIAPDYEVEMPEAVKKLGTAAFDTESDAQLNWALDYLKNGH